MNVLLVQPPMVEGSTYFELPLNIAYLASSLRRRGIAVRVLDMQLETFERLHEILAADHPRVIGTTTYSYSLNVTSRLARAFREGAPEATIVLGGPHASFAARESLERFPEIDAVFCGEAEAGFGELCERILGGEDSAAIAGAVPNVVLRDGPAEPRDLPLQRIDEIPFASDVFDLFDIPKSLGRNRFVPILASRGCVYRCTFCLSPTMWGNLRIRSWPNLRAELERYREMGLGAVNFRDDVFSLLRPLMAPLLEYLGTNGFEWGCETRLDDMTPERSAEFGAAGMSRIRVSVETMKWQSLLAIGKNPRHIDVRSRIRALTDHCPDVRVSFMIGIPGDTVADVHSTMDFAETLQPAVCKFWAFSPLPGTPIYRDPAAHGITRILPHDQLDPLFSFIETESMSNDQINALLVEAQQRFADPYWSRDRATARRVS